MKKHQVIYFHTLPNARFHFGEVSNATNLDTSSIYPHSDTLTGAILSNAYLLNSQVAEGLKEALQQGHIKISSASFFVDNGNQKTLFFPKPQMFDTYVLQDSQAEDHKKVKRVEFISKGVWEKAYLPEQWLDKSKNKCETIQKGRFVCLQEECTLTDQEVIYSMSETPKVPLNYINSTSTDKQTIYTQVDVFVNALPLNYSSGYFCLIDYELGDAEKLLLEQSIEQIKYHGLGGDRSTGAGQIASIDIQDFEWNIQGAQTVHNLSILLPQESTAYHQGLYRMILRGGQNLNQAESLPLVQCIKEGGTFSKEIAGSVYEMRKDKIMNGVAYFAPSKYKLYGEKE